MKSLAVLLLFSAAAVSPQEANSTAAAPSGAESAATSAIPASSPVAGASRPAATKPVPAWKYSGSSGCWVIPDLANESRIFAACASRLVALDAQTGKELWRQPTARPSYAATGGAGILGLLVVAASGEDQSIVAPVQDADTIYFATGHHHEFVALNKADGTVRWQIKEPRRTYPAPALAGDCLLLYAEKEREFECRDVGDGHRRWVSAPQKAAGSMLIRGEYAAGDGFFAVEPDGGFSARNLADGAARWRIAPDVAKASLLLARAGAGIFFTIVSRSFLPPSPATLTVHALADGRKLWSAEMPNGHTGALIANDRVYYIGSEGYLYAKTALTGETVLKQYILGGDATTYMAANPDGLLFVNSYSSVVKLGWTGKMQWALDHCTIGHQEPPVAAGGRIFYGCGGVVRSWR